MPAPTPATSRGSAASPPRTVVDERLRPTAAGPSPCLLVLRGWPLHEGVSEPALDAEVSAGDVVVEGRGHLHDVVVLDVQLEGAPNPAVGADRLGDGLPCLIPRSRTPHVVLRLEHESPRGAHPDAVPAVDAGGFGEGECELGGDHGVEAPAGHGDGESVLGVHPASLHALVAKDAPGVVAHIQIVVDLDRLMHGGRARSAGWLVVAWVASVAFALASRLGRLAIPRGIGPVPFPPSPEVWPGR